MEAVQSEPRGAGPEEAEALDSQALPEEAKAQDEEAGLEEA